MILKYDIQISSDAIQNNLKRIINQIYKLLPLREEGADWQLPLSTVMEELSGMRRLLIGEEEAFFSLLCKMEGLYQLDHENDFLFYRRTIFECIGLLDSIKKNVNKES